MSSARSIHLVLGLSLALTSMAGAQTDFELRLTAGSFDNFFQAPGGAQEQDVDTLAARLRVDWTIFEGEPDRLYGWVEGSSWEDLEDPLAVRLGALGDRGRWEYDVHVESITDRPTADFEQVVSLSDLLRFGAEVGWRVTEDWQVTPSVELRRQTFDLTPQNDNDYTSLGVAVRYRGWGSVFSPEVGYAVAERDADSENESLDQDELWIKLRSALSPTVYLTVRYRMRERDYTVTTPGASNFGRRDDRDQWTLTADWQALRRIGLSLYYSNEDADSTRPSRVFESGLASLSLVIDF